MNVTDRVKNCNGCGACVVACKNRCTKLVPREEESLKKVVWANNDGCMKCNACSLFCPLFNPVELPHFDEFFEYDKSFDERDMPALYRQTMRGVKAGQHVEFVGTLCQIAALKSLSGDKLRPNLIVKPLWCTEEKRESDPACIGCMFYADYQQK